MITPISALLQAVSVAPQSRRHHPHGIIWACVLVASLHALRTQAADEVSLEEEAAFRGAAAVVAPAVVRVEVAGASAIGLGAAAEVAPASGASSGLVVASDGWVIATSFAVPNDASQAVITLPDGNRLVARVAGRDVARGLVLLKMELPAGAAPLLVPEAAPRDTWLVGQWTIALGRGWNAAEPSVGVGILSATNRAWGRAVQTDASVSPANYGGPLLDIHGRVIGILAPLPAEMAGMMAGTELYDSGIGFAVPLEDMFRVLPRLQAGETLAPGIMGIGYPSRDPLTSSPVVATCRAGSPAARAGIRVGDRIIEAAGRPVTRVAHLRHAIAGLYAGDRLELVVERGTAGERVPLGVELVASLPPWRRPVLGIVPRRIALRPDANEAEGKGVEVVWLWPDGPAARAGLLPGDIVTAVRVAPRSGEAEDVLLPVPTAAVLSGFVAGVEPGTVLQLSVDRAGQSSAIDVAVAVQPTFVPAAPVRDIDPATTSIEKLEAAEIARPPLAVLPAATADAPLGVIVYCGLPGEGGGAVSPGAPAGGQAKGNDGLEASLRRNAERWKAAATRYGVAVVLPSSGDPQRWGREDIQSLARALDTLRQRRPIDASRIAFAGSGAGGAFAWLAADALGPAVRGVALLDATLPRQATIQPTEPGRSRAVLFGTVPGGPVAKVDADRRKLEEAGYPVGLLPELVGDGLPVETLCSWVESLGLL
ncbi:MAG: PDZ domain-containing protein [Planctomycetota bacterium]|nr:MAG: PDZ domain-containing protein [Planctomycetota bacterium]